MQVVSHAINPSVPAVRIVFSQMEGVYLSFLWVSPDVVGSVVWSQACKCVT